MINAFSLMLDKIELQSAISAPAMRMNEKKTARQRQSGPVVLGKQERKRTGAELLQQAQSPVRQSVVLSKSDRILSSPKQAVRRPAPEGQTELLAGKRKVRAFIYRISSKEKKEITRSEFRIGKSSRDTDYCVSNNSAVSRRHAKIIRRGDKFYIMDTNSLNHTYVNKVMLQEGKLVALEHGAEIRFADEEFLFFIEKV